MRLQYGVRLWDDDPIIPVEKATLDVLSRRLAPTDVTFYQRTIAYGDWEAAEEVR